MSDRDAREAAAAVFAAMNERDVELLVARLAPAAVFHFPGTKPLEGPDRIARFIKILFHRYPRLEFTTGRVIADERCAAVEWTNEGEDRGGEPYRNAGVTVIELAAGKIAYLSDTFKDTAVFTRR
jgi:ketosteroid isomerase-like protein